MKKGFYYTSLIVLWVVVVFLLAFLLILLGPIPTNFVYSLGIACGFPQLWIIAVGIVLLLRPIVWRIFTKENRTFKNSVAITILIVGIIWLSMSVGARILHDQATESIIEQYEP